jgi:hypothetical protein
MQFLRFSGYTHVEVEPNDNTPMMAQQVYKNVGLPFAIAQVRIYEGVPGGQLCSITGWSSENGGSPVAVYAVQIDDSSEGSAFLVYGGDYGVRLKPGDSEEPWDTASTDQWGETHLVLASEDDLTRAP